MAGKFPKNRVQHQGAGYDDAGRMTTLESRNVEYDFDGRITKITVSTGPTSNEQTMWFYDGEGRRVREEKWTGGVSGPVTQLWETVFVYDPLGALVAEYDTRGPQGTAGTKYLTVDHLGSTRMVTKGSGNTEAEVVDSRHDYLPFGEEVRSSGGPKEKFTGKERAEVSGTRVDYFGARYLSAGLGRFLSPDKPLVDQHTSDPQSWNLYVYVRNSPLEFHDPDGQVCIFGIGDTCSQLPPVLNPPPPPPPPVLKPNGQPALTPSGQAVQGPVQVGPSVGGLSAAPTPGLGIGLTAGATGVAGLGVVGTAATANVAGVLFANREDHLDVSAGASVTGGAMTAIGKKVYGTPVNQASDSFAVGLFGGAGGGVLVTNAGTSHSTGGEATVFSFDVGGGMGASIQIGFSGKVVAASFTIGPGVGLAASKLTTHTTATGRRR